ncbi:MAG: 3-oxoacyl-ACP reductase FabG [Gammaproteobacteria bacterium]|jgi:3-oxoacyl-[acyl-carrier protein] reductase|nr:3-oxoacyl-ACP reductase FabG [Gammaproteobacteria bacterium]MBT3488119.1 3-oxoacyl-ACP reductase FabG [Gammaproteobacteria bacterium]MBT3717860.1 3-oxoacyl-ACP reductase FabG [Gammaproteobacteria bacterium]MBT3845364.1 3-oxoacyl-ACP reductase FabG [Gammaproteobacteria bacterium]MBT3894416.1 3-oxoacyl-ACP reductase FabG [Gammaproteobacteria bacterium]
MSNLEGKVALVTGASRGIGQAVALKLGAMGATVVGTATSDPGADNISAYMQEAGITGHGVKLDVTDPNAIDEIIKQIADQHGAITILVNNAGITRDNLLMRMKEEEWGAIMDTNLTSIFRVSKACLRGMMKARNGRIISITSVVGAMGNAGQSNYAAAKAGVMGFSKSLAREVASRGITVNTVAPGFIDTDMTKSLPDEQKEALKAQIPLGALGQPEDIANSVGFLASEESAYVTGQTLHVNGGMYM